MESKEDISERSGFMTPPYHINFLAKKLSEKCGEMQDISIAYLGPNGGGPITPHSHPHNHLFVVTSGEAKVIFSDEEVIIHENESFLVEGKRLHSVWNNTDKTTTMIGITVV